MGPKLSHLGIFGRELKLILSYLISAPSNFSNCQTWWKNEHAYTWDQKRLIWVILGWHLKAKLPHLKSASSFAIFCDMMKMSNFRTKNGYGGYFWAGILKEYCHILKSIPSNLSNCKFREKVKMAKFGTKNTLLGYFWTRIL